MRVKQVDLGVGNWAANRHDLIHGLFQYVYKLGGKPPFLADGSAEAPFSNFSGGVSFMEQIHQICGALPGQIKKQIPICMQPRYRS